MRATQKPPFWLQRRWYTDICLWVLLLEMANFRPCVVISSGHIQSMLPCFFLAKPEFYSFLFAKASSTMPGIFLRTFHDRCRRSARTRLRGSFFICKLELAILAPSYRCELLRSRRFGPTFGSHSSERFFFFVCKPEFAIPAASRSCGLLRSRRFGPTFRPAAMVPDICLWVLL